MTEPDLFDKLNTMPKSELESFLLTAQITSKLSDVVGIGVILLSLLLSNEVMIFISCIALYFFGWIAVGADDVQSHIRALLETKFKDK